MSKTKKQKSNKKKSNVGLTILILGLILLIVSLFFGFTYRFEGETDLKAANDVMEKASGAAEKVKEEFRK